MKYFTSKTVLTTAVLALSLSIGCSKSKGGGVAVATTPATTDCAINPQNCQYNQQYAGYGFYLTSAVGYGNTGYQSMKFQTAVFSNEDVNSNNNNNGFGYRGPYNRRKSVNMGGQVEILVNHSAQGHNRNYSANQSLGHRQQYGCPQIIDGTYNVTTLQAGELSSSYRRGRGHRRSSPNLNTGVIRNLKVRLSRVDGSGQTVDIDMENVTLGNNGIFQSHQNGGNNSLSKLSGQASVSGVNGQQCYLPLDIDSNEEFFVQNIFDGLF